MFSEGQGKGVRLIFSPIRRTRSCLSQAEAMPPMTSHVCGAIKDSPSGSLSCRRDVAPSSAPHAGTRLVTE